MNGEYISIETLRIIQSLEQENKRLAEELEIEKDISDGMLEAIDKAINFIENNFITYKEANNYRLDIDSDIKVSISNFAVLIDILKGSDENGNKK